MFKLDERLMRDTTAVAESPLSLLRLFNDERYFWIVLIPKVAQVSEWFELETVNQQVLLQESLACSKVIAAQPGILKVNMGALGNIVRQLHVHIVGRHETDPAWPGPVWGHSSATKPNQETLSMRTKVLRHSVLADLFSF